MNAHGSISSLDPAMALVNPRLSGWSCWHYGWLTALRPSPTAPPPPASFAVGKQPTAGRDQLLVTPFGHARGDRGIQQLQKRLWVSFQPGLVCRAEFDELFRRIAIAAARVSALIRVASRGVGNGKWEARLIRFLNGEGLATGAVARQHLAKDPKRWRPRLDSVQSAE